MRATTLLLIGSIGCIGCGGGGSQPDTFELDIAVDAPAAASALVDGTHALPATGGIFAQGFVTLADAMKVSGTVATLAADGSVRAMAMYAVGSYCAAETPLIRETLSFVEGTDANNDLQLTLDIVECEKQDGTGTIITP